MKGFNAQLARFMQALHNINWAGLFELTVEAKHPTGQLPTEPVPDQVGKLLRAFIKPVQDFANNPGKLFRPFVFFTTAYYVSRVVYRPLYLNLDPGAPLMVDIGAFIELVHAHLLIHDDICDKSTKRRGKPTVWYSYLQNLPALDHHTANSLGIIAGDLVLAAAYKKLADADGLSAEAKETIWKITQQHMHEVIYGQAIDILLTSTPFGNVTEQTIWWLYKYKTARYTFVFPAAVGAGIFGMPLKYTDVLKLSDMPQQHLRLIHGLSQNYGKFVKFLEQLGVVFQLVDDVKDYTLDTKQRFLDLAERKRTHFHLILYKKDARIRQFFDKTQVQTAVHTSVSPAETTTVLDSDTIELGKYILQKYIPEYIEFVAEKYETIKSKITKTTLNRTYKNILREIVKKLDEYFAKVAKPIGWAVKN